jgi:hypothetical protein
MNKVLREGGGKLRKEENIFTQGTWLSHWGEARKDGNSKVLFKERLLPGLRP